MARARRTAQQSQPIARARLYARVSSKDQAKEGFSIPAQLKLLRQYAAEEGLTVAEEYVDVETAKRTGRVSFGKMVHDLRTSSGARIVLVEKTDRLYRNLKDWVTLDELDVEVHLVKEAVVLSAESRSSEKFMHGIKVLMAKNYIDNLSEEVRKGMAEKAAQGLWPSSAPLGYRNVTGTSGQKIIEPDPNLVPTIVRLFEWYATGTMSLKDVTRKARSAGLSFRKSGAPFPSAQSTRCSATGSIWESSTGRGVPTREFTSQSSRASCGNECRRCWTVATPTATDAPSTTSRFRG